MTSPLPGPAAPLPQLPPPQPVYPAGPALPKNPWAALALSLFPGVGQIYNGQLAKGIFFFFAEAFCVYGAADINWFPFAFLIPFVYFYNLVDAWRSATLINARFLGGQSVAEEDADDDSPVWGAGLIAMGFLLLLHNLGWLRFAALERWWPLLIVVVGASFLLGSLRRRQAAAPPSDQDRAR